ncbi:hypothetical protein D3C86_1576520 [compost metagenome]
MQLLQQVQVAQYKCIFSKYTYRIAVLEAYLQYLPGQFHFALCGLITICIGRQGDDGRSPAFLFEGGSQALCSILLGYDFGFEIQPCTVAPVFVRVTGIAVNTTMLAALVGVH